MKKINGSYYTPLKLVSFLLDKTFTGLNYLNENTKILEPSCGDGIFIKGLDHKLSKLAKKKIILHYIEKQKEELDKARKQKTINRNLSRRSYCQDFLDYQKTTKNRYDLIIGNPPYIYKNYLSDIQKDKCMDVHEVAGLSKKRIKNIWTAFFVACERLLTPNGTLAFVLPAEFLNVNFTTEIRNFAKNKFERIEIYTFNELFFGDAGQDTLVFIGRKISQDKGVYSAHIDSFEKGKYELRKSGQYNDKWNQAILSTEEIRLLKRLGSSLKEMGEYCESNAGIVTAANDYFIVDSKTINKFKLSKYAKQVIQKGFFVNGHMNFTKKDFNDLSASDKPCYLLDFNGHDATRFSDNVKEYLAIGESREIDKRYKCISRKRWFDVPSIISSEAFFFKRAHYYSKLLKNDCDVFVTDSAYRVRMKIDYLNDIDSLVFSYYNSLTLCLAELGGRYYGGGVLELTPNEFRALKIPFKKIGSSKFEKFMEIFNNKSSIEEVCKYTDLVLLKEVCDCKDSDILMLRQIRKKLLRRRMKKEIN